jgi:hypothetical protein
LCDLILPLSQAFPYFLPYIFCNAKFEKRYGNY